MMSGWAVQSNGTVAITYPDGDKVIVNAVDFNRAFGAIINASKEDVIRDFAISTDA
jgi:hypothetical protein